MNDLVAFAVLAALGALVIEAARRSGAKFGIPGPAVPVIGAGILMVARKLR